MFIAFWGLFWRFPTSERHQRAGLKVKVSQPRRKQDQTRQNPKMQQFLKHMRTAYKLGPLLVYKLAYKPILTGVTIPVSPFRSPFIGVVSNFICHDRLGVHLLVMLGSPSVFLGVETSRKTKMEKMIGNSYCWWLKSQTTTWDVWNPIK